MIKQVILALCIACAPPAAALAQEAQSSGEPSILDKAINTPSVDTWSVYGQRQRSSVVRSAGVVDGRALRVRVAQGDNPWSIGVNAPIAGQINQGDVLMLAYWARVQEPPEGEETGVISSARVQLAADPYTEVFSAPSTRITAEWKLYCTAGVANRAFAPNEAGISLHLAAARQVIELGPPFVLNFGANYDVARLRRECGQ
jgi:hypothetical protein